MKQWPEEDEDYWLNDPPPRSNPMTNEKLPNEVHGPNVGVVAAFATKRAAEKWVADDPRRTAAGYFIVGPDAIAPGEPGCPPARLAESDKDGTLATDSGDKVPELSPAITFKPYEPSCPTLDQMPEGEPHNCALSELYQSQIILVLVRHGTQAYRATVDGGSQYGEHDVWHANANQYTVLDADPPQPETLADVPPEVWCVDKYGIIWHQQGAVHCIYNLNETASDPEDSDPDLSDYPITRVLGAPEVRL